MKMSAFDGIVASLETNRMSAGAGFMLGIQLATRHPEYVQAMMAEAIAEAASRDGFESARGTAADEAMDHSVRTVIERFPVEAIATAPEQMPLPMAVWIDDIDLSGIDANGSESQ